MLLWVEVIAAMSLDSGVLYQGGSSPVTLERWGWCDNICCRHSNFKIWAPQCVKVSRPNEDQKLCSPNDYWWLFDGFPAVLLPYVQEPGNERGLLSSTLPMHLTNHRHSSYQRPPPSLVSLVYLTPDLERNHDVQGLRSSNGEMWIMLQVDQRRWRRPGKRNYFPSTIHASIVTLHLCHCSSRN